MDPNGRRTTATPATTGSTVPPSVLTSPSGWASVARAEVARDPLGVALAVVMAALAVVLVARGLTLSQSGGILRLAPYATLVLGPLVAALAVLRPWAGLVAWVVLMPVLNIARVAVSVGDVQLILPTLVIAALALGLWLARRHPSAAVAATAALPRMTYLGAAALIALTILSVAAGTAGLDRAIPIALHGVIEPAILLAIVVALRPGWRHLAALTIAMGGSVAVATMVNLVRVAAVRDQLTTANIMRAQLARLTYYNVGIYGDMLAMGIPLLAGGLLMRRALRIPGWGALVMAGGLALSVVGLYLTFSKSGWLGAAAGAGVLLLLTVRSWRVRIGTLAVAAVLVAVVIPYPAYLLRYVSPDLATSFESIVSIVNTRSSTIDPSTPEGEVSVTERVLATIAALQMTVDHPVLGVGPGGFANEYAAHYRPADSTRALDSAHDLLPYVAAEFGLPAAALVGIALVGAIVLSWLAGLRAAPPDVIARIVPFSLASALVAFVIVGTTFGVDLYRDYRTINSDVIFVALLVGSAVAAWGLASARSAEA